MTDPTSQEPITPAADAAVPTIFDVYETDTSAEEDGRWFVGYFGDRAQGDVKLRGFTSQVSINVRRRLEATFRRHMRADGTYPTDVAQRMVTEQLAQAIIVDWRGAAFKNKDGSDIPFSPGMAKSLLERLPHFRNRVAQSAGELDNFRAATTEAIEKN